MTFSPHSTMGTYLAVGDRIKNQSHGPRDVQPRYQCGKWPAHDRLFVSWSSRKSSGPIIETGNEFTLKRVVSFAIRSIRVVSFAFPFRSPASCLPPQSMEAHAAACQNACEQMPARGSCLLSCSRRKQKNETRFFCFSHSEKRSGTMSAAGGVPSIA